MSKYYTFGKLLISKKFLNENKLRIRSGKAYTNVAIKHDDISHKLKQSFKTLLREGEINYLLLKELEQDEKDIFTNFMYKSGVSDNYNFDEAKMNYIIEDILYMYEIQKGSIMAGNNSKRLLQDIVKTLKLMAEHKLITPKEHGEILQEIIEESNNA